MRDRKPKLYSYACGFCIIFLWTGLWLQYRYDSRQALVAAETTVSNLATAFEENIQGTVQHLDEFLITLRWDYIQHKNNIPALISSLNQNSDRDLIIQLSIIDSAGIMVYNTKGMPDKPLDLSDREHFRVHLNSSDDKLFISKPVMGRVSKKWSIQFTRKLMNQDGSFAGVAVLSVDPDSFNRFYQSIDVGSKGVITLVGMDGIIRARSIATKEGKNPIGTAVPLSNEMLDPARPKVGIYYAPSIVDGISRIVAYRRLKEYPLVVRVALAESEALSALHRHRTNIVILGTIATGGLLMILWLAIRLDSRQQLYTRELESINRDLQQRVDESIAVLRRNDQVMISQSRQAAMGEMIGNIAHQWRQPLNALSMLITNIQLTHHDNSLSEEYMNDSAAIANRLIQKMSTTINDFRNFFSPDKEMVTFSTLTQIQQSIGLIEASFKSSNIGISLDAEGDCMLKGYPNEYSQVLLNLLANGRDAILEAGVTQGHIAIKLAEQDGKGVVYVRDNGGGIPESVLDRIFEPYFSTKSMGTGIGLYMSKMIIERNMNGSITACNMDGGAEFRISVELAVGTA